jgi:hypothetical protein
VPTITTAKLAIAYIFRAFLLIIYSRYCHIIANFTWVGLNKSLQSWGDF